MIWFISCPNTISRSDMLVEKTTWRLILSRGIHLAEKIRPFYYFKNMDSILYDFCKRCVICIKNKTRSGGKIGLLSQLGPASRPFEIMSIDTIGGFSGNKSSKRYMHILVDHFSRMAFISTTTNQTNDHFIELIDRVTRNEILLSDQHASLNPKKLKRYLEQRKIRLVFTSVNTASSSGLNERLNQTLVNRL